MDDARAAPCRTDIQAAVIESQRLGNVSFTVCLRKCSTSVPYQQSIPMGFVKYHEILYLKAITLEGPTGRTWTTIMRPSSNYSVRLCKGWRQFSQDNHLRNGYQLMFTFAGQSRFLVHFFDHEGKRCTSYPPLPATHSPLPHEQTREQEEHTSAAWAGSEDMEIDAEETEAAAEANIHTSGLADTDSHPPATKQKQPLVQPERNTHHLKLKELSLSQPTDFPSRVSPAPPPPPNTRDHSSAPSSDIELPGRNDVPSKLQETPVSRMKLSVRRPPYTSFHAAAGASRDSRAMRLLHQQWCRHFSEIVSKPERRDVSDQWKLRVVETAMRFGKALETKWKFLVVMTENLVYHKFRLHIPEKFLELSTGVDPADQRSVCLLDREEALYEGHWTRENASDPPLLECGVWAQFALDHALEEGDVCVFQREHEPEPAPPGGSAVRFRVHIFRVVERFLPSPGGSTSRQALET